MLLLGQLMLGSGHDFMFKDRRGGGPALEKDGRTNASGKSGNPPRAQPLLKPTDESGRIGKGRRG